MGVIIRKDLPCIGADCQSSDAMQVYDDGSAFCFSCNKFHSAAAVEAGTDILPNPSAVAIANSHGFEKTELSSDIMEYPIQGFRERKIPKHICEFFGVRVSFGSDGVIDKHYYPYNENKGWKVRKVVDKYFYWVNKQEGLFGKDKFNATGKYLYIGEGEIDTMSIEFALFEQYKRYYPAIGLASSTMVASLIEEREWIRSFDEVILCFDMDKAGKEATEKAITIIGLDKVKIVKFREMDANLVLTEHGPQALMQDMFGAARHIPDGIISKEALWKKLEEFNLIESIPYPPCLAGLNDKLKGMRFKQIALFISGTGSGKSTMLREIILHILGTTEHACGVVSLEEAPEESAKLLSGMVLNRNPADVEIPIEELKPGFDKVFGEDRVVLIDHGGSMNDDSIMDRLEYLCLIGCKFIFVDHVTILASEGAGNETGNEAIDKIMNSLARLAKRHDVWIGLVSHLRKSQNNTKSFEEGRLPSIDDIRGSGSIKQISYDIIAFARDMTAETEVERNTIKSRILKCRHTGKTGDVDGSTYDFPTGRLAFAKNESVEETGFVRVD